MSRAVAITALLLIAPPAAGAAEPDPPSLGFDHITHEGRLAVAGAEPIACARCHPIDAAGRLTTAPGHRTCFGACHGRPPPARTRGRPYPVPAERRRLCSNCHRPAEVDRAARGAGGPLRPFYPPYQLESDYGLSFAHARHRAPARALEGCLTCHAVPAEPGPPAARAASGTRPRRTAAHGRCGPCHAAPRDPAVPAMSACATCHLEAFGPATVPHRQPGLFPVDATFSHARHLPRAGGGAAACESCHARAAGAATGDVPSPDTAACARCHDGTAAFSTTGPSCRRCHQQPRQRIVGLTPKPARFSHATHEPRRAGSCASCHAGGGDAPASRDHRPCSDAGCHRDEFASTRPILCSACHVGIEPWRPLRRENRPPPETEFGAVFSHRRHLGGASPPVKTACDGCHQESSAERDMRPPRDHESCAGAGCHVPGGVAPTPADCDGCHRRDLVAERRRERLDRRWSVRARFRHGPHRSDAAGKPVACLSCHAGVIDAEMLADVPAPAKATCVPCHDGATAFKITGHACQRCHAR